MKLSTLARRYENARRRAEHAAQRRDEYQARLLCDLAAMTGERITAGAFVIRRDEYGVTVTERPTVDARQLPLPHVPGPEAAA